MYDIYEHVVDQIASFPKTTEVTESEIWYRFSHFSNLIISHM
jgi:hypothetical protein